MARKGLRHIALAVMVIALVGASVWWFRSPTATTVAGTSASGGTASGAAEAKNRDELDLQGLQAERPAPQDSTRNPFRFKPKAPPPPPPGPARSAEPVNMGSVEQPPPRIPLKFIGVMNQGGRGQVAILSDSRGVYYGREGETIEGQYRILRIGVESVDLAYLDGRGRQTIRLTGQ